MLDVIVDLYKHRELLMQDVDVWNEQDYYLPSQYVDANLCNITKKLIV